MATVRTVTVKPSGGDYTSLAAAISGEAGNLVALDRQLDIECHAFEDTAVVNVTGYTTDATRYIRIYAAQNHGGKWNNSVYRYSYSGASNSFTVGAQYTRVEGIQIDRGVNGPYNAIQASSSAGSYLLIDRVIARCIGTGGSGTTAFVAYDGAINVIARNSLAYGFNSHSASRGWYFIGTGNKTQNCTAVDCYVGFHGADAYNCGAVDCTTPFASMAGQTTCSSSTPIFVDADNYDFHLAFSDTVWKGNGTDLSADFTIDIDGQTRSSWDIGADEYISAGGYSLNKDTAWKLFNDLNKESSWKLFNDVINNTAWKIFSDNNQQTVWRIFNKEEQQSSWKIHNKKDQQTIWRILNALNLDQQIAWKIFNKENQTISWRIFDALLTNALWKILAGKDQQISWKIFINKDSEVSWKILTGLSKEVAWKIFNNSLVDQQTAWKILNNNENITSWKILAGETKQVSWKIFNLNDIDTSWFIKNDIGVASSWRIYNNVDIDTAWDIISDIIAEPAKTFDTQQRIFIFDAVSRTLIFNTNKK
jgi:hypothetical protein